MMTANSIVILGIDPGLRETGYAVAAVDLSKRKISKVLALGLLSTRKTNIRTVRVTSDYLTRVQQQSAALRELVELHNPSIIAYEVVATAPYTLPTFSFGAMMGIAAGLNKPILEVLPREVKQVVSGRGTATKTDMIKWAMQATASQKKIVWPVSQRASKLGLQFQGKHVSPTAEH